MSSTNPPEDFPDNAGRSLSNALSWRQRAIQLAVEAKLDGQAQRVPGKTAAGSPLETYRCISVTEPNDHFQVYDSSAGTIYCDCPAGFHGRPCKHAGAALLLITGLVPERVRDPEGNAQ